MLIIFYLNILDLKNKGKKKKEEVPVLKDYHPEELVTALNVKFKEEEKEIEDLIEKLTKKNRDYEMQEEEKENKKENIKKKKVKKKGKKVSKKNSGDKSDKSEKSEKREKTPDKKKEKENDFVQLYNLFILYLSDSNYDGEIISIFAELLEKNKNFILLKKLENLEKIRIIIKNEYSKDKSSIIGDINISKLYFFLILSSPDLVDEDLSEVKLNEKLIEEKKLINNLENRKDADILFNSELQKYFDEAYGEKAAELILIGAKESSIHEILIGFSDEKQMTISFKDLIERIYEEDDEEKKIEFKDEDIQNKFEEIEDMIFSGKEHKLYNIVIDYMKKEIRILYLRRPEYTPEQKEELLKRVKDMKTKLQGILKAIEKI